MSADDRISSYLLGELEPIEVAEFERRLAADPALRGEVEALRPVVARLEATPAEVWEPTEPPPLRLPRERATDAAASPERSRRRRWRLPTVTLRPAPAIALAALLLAIGLGGGLLIDGGSDRPGGGPDLVLSRIDDGPVGAHGEVVLASDEQRARIEIGGLAPSGAGEFYELWLLDDDGRMIALGSFRVGGQGEAKVDLPLPVDPALYRYFDISMQEDNGDPTHSGVSVLRGSTSS